MIRLTDTLNDLYFEIMLLQFTLPVFVIAFVIFKIASEMTDIIESMILLIYVGVVIFELFVYCLFATLLTSKVRK